MLGTVLAVAALAAVATAATTTTSARPAAAVTSHQQARLGLSYSCAYPGGSTTVPVTVAATFPRQITAGQTIRPAGITVAPELPSALLRRLLGSRAMQVSGTARLTVTVTQPTQQTTPSRAGSTGQGGTGTGATAPARITPGPVRTATTTSPAQSQLAQSQLTPPQLAQSQLTQSQLTQSQLTQPGATPPGIIRPTGTSVVWPDLTWPVATLPATGPLRSTAAGPVPGRTVRQPGRITFRAGPLALTLTPVAGAPGASGAPGAANAAAPQLTCVPAPGQALTLATVTARPGPGGPGGPGRAVRQAGHKHFCPSQPKGGYKLNPRFKPPKVPKGIVIHKPPPELGCADVVGYANVAKLREASKLGPAVVAVSVAVQVDYNFSTSDYFQEDSAGVLDYRPCQTCKVQHGLPPTRATFLAFGFEPATATMHLTELGTLNLFGIGTTSALKVNYSYAQLTLRLSNVEVNGEPLAVGPDCHAVRPLTVELVGRANSHPPYALQTGGPLDGRVNIGAFTGCGVGENLDPLFTGTISGPGNFSVLTQGSLCTPASNSGCPPKRRKPIH